MLAATNYRYRNGARWRRQKRLITPTAATRKCPTDSRASRSSEEVDARLTWLEKLPKRGPPWYPVVLAYREDREAGMFVNHLRESERPAFERMMNAFLDEPPRSRTR